MVFNALSTIFQLYCDDKFYWWNKLEVSGENHRPVTDRHYQIMLYRVHVTMSRIRTLNFSGGRHWLCR